ncbi:glyoxalase [Dactylosporangium sp. NBC_01737]|uniref:VOC family protein n=1 Tax=Dactylosporangium sp. NBC_01737 TaxID=2975959 RepID=UPI002E10A003|nr:glyoxalase [Dactylosporangium sp. NBC_01737]
MLDLKLEIVVLPVSDVDRAKAFFNRIGFRENADFSGEGGFRVVQVTPPGSTASIIFGSRVTDAVPGSTRGVYLVVDDIVAAQKELATRGADVSEVFHDAGGVFHHAGTEARLPGPDPQRQSYGSFATFTDPDGNMFVLQEVTRRLPGRVEHAIYRSAAELEHALRDAAAAHGRHEQEIGREDPDWPAWYAAYMAKAAGMEA